MGILSYSSVSVTDLTDNLIDQVRLEYYLSTSPTELDGGSWSSDTPIWIDGQFIWQKTIIVYLDGTTDETEPICVTGQTGAEGEASLSVNIESSNGNIFKGNNISTTLTCKVYYGVTEVTDKVKTFTWHKILPDGTMDENWNRTLSGNVINLTNADVFEKASFTCSVEIDL